MIANPSIPGSLPGVYIESIPVIVARSNAFQAEFASKHFRPEFGLIRYRSADDGKDSQKRKNWMAENRRNWDALKQSGDTSYYETETCVGVEKKLLDYFLQAEDKRFKKKSTILRWHIVFDIRKIKLINS